VDKVLSIVSGVLVSAMMILVAWLGSTRSLDFDRKSLGRGLAAMGGPLGLAGGIILVVAVGVAVYGVHELVNVGFGRAIIRRLRSRGRSDADIAAQLDTMPISRGLKRQLKKDLKA